jgi:hypothetical protein
MLSRKKIAAVTGLLGGLALACVGVAQAYDGATTRECTTDSQGTVSCVHVQKSDTSYTSEDGTTHVSQSQNCSVRSKSRVERPEGSTGQQGTTEVGSRISCGNKAGAPKGIVMPHISLD